MTPREIVLEQLHHLHLAMVNHPVKAASIPRMTGTTSPLLNLQEKGIAVAIDENLPDNLIVTGGLPLHP